ncbi:MAG: hypothetical protein V3V28_02310, partial [Polaribacter sp.]|uniref:hypothetical protein n=1 Tax=Polaribacter sp. TaxID=1920175 RepID=UPI002F35D2C3
NNRGGTTTTNSDPCSSTNGVILSQDQIDLADILECFNDNNTAQNPIIGPWLNDQLSPENRENTYLSDIANFLEESDCSLDARNFTNEAIEAIINGAEVDWEEQIINELTDECAKNIFKSIKNETGLGPTVDSSITQSFTLSGEILNMFDSSDKFSYTIKNGTYSNNANTTTSGNTFTTTISDEYLGKGTKLSIARTMIHESVHAHILNNIKPRVNPSFYEDIKYYAEKYGYSDANRYHHEFMAKYIKAMAVSLYTWDKNNGGGNLDWDYYEAMAYGGLYYKDSNGNITETDSFKVLEPLKIHRDRIRQILFNEQEGNANAKGHKCN